MRGLQVHFTLVSAGHDVLVHFPPFHPPADLSKPIVIKIYRAVGYYMYGRYESLQHFIPGMIFIINYPNTTIID